jgi:predicted nucleotidyltransferase
VGGAVTQFYIEDFAAYRPRVTDDVDFTFKISSYGEYQAFQQSLVDLGFKHNPADPGAICTMYYQGIKVDVMPDDGEILGFSNKWYREGLNSSETFDIPGGEEIYIFPIHYFLASKLEAYNDRGGGDLLGSPDFEDFISVLDGQYDLDIIKSFPDVVQEYLKTNFKALLKDIGLRQAVAAHIGFTEGEQRANRIIEFFRKFI